jgi:hypothetical protein
MNVLKRVVAGCCIGVVLVVLSTCRRSETLSGEPDVSAPQASAPQTTGCTKDTDCKGERVCEEGRCVPPTPSAQSSITPTTGPSPRQVPLNPPRAVRIMSVAGPLEAVSIQPLTVADIRLGGRRIVHTNALDVRDPHANGPEPSFVALFENTAGFDQVVAIRWDGAGNACNGYGFTFLGVNRDGTFKLSSDVPFCGGPDPDIRLSPDGIALIVPDHAPNRGLSGTLGGGVGVIKGERWVFAHGTVKKL